MQNTNYHNCFEPTSEITDYKIIPSVLKVRKIGESYLPPSVIAHVVRRINGIPAVLDPKDGYLLMARTSKDGDWFCPVAGKAYNLPISATALQYKVLNPYTNEEYDFIDIPFTDSLEDDEQVVIDNEQILQWILNTLTEEQSVYGNELLQWINANIQISQQEIDKDELLEYIQNHLEIDTTPDYNALDERYLKKDDFEKLFRYHDGEEDGIPESIEALFGLWTERFLSAKGVSNDNSENQGGILDEEALADYLREHKYIHDSNNADPYDITNYLSQFLTAEDLADYAKTSDLSDYLKTEDAEGFIDSDDLDSAITQAKQWVTNNFLSKEEFQRLFHYHDGTEEGIPKSIEAMLGLWTEQFLSAKGVGSDTSTGGGGGIDYEALEEYLRDNLAGYLSQYAKISDIPDVSGFLTDYDVKSISVNGGAQQPLKGSGNVDIKAATSIDGSGHITAGALQSDGSISVGVESGYGIPSNSKQQGWDAAKALLEELFEKVNLGTDSNPQWTIKAKMSLWTEGFLSAKGVGDGSAEGGIGYEAVQEMIAEALQGYNPSTGSIDWDSITGKPDTFAPSAHSHSWGSISDKPSTFAPSAHTHTKSDITDFAHGHGIADVTGLQTALDALVPTSRTITAGTGLAGGGTLAADRTISLNATNAGLLQMLSDMFEWQTVGGVRTIKAKASLWTDGYLSAKGTDGDVSGDSAIDDLNADILDIRAALEQNKAQWQSAVSSTNANIAQVSGALGTLNTTVNAIPRVSVVDGQLKIDGTAKTLAYGQLSGTPTLGISDAGVITIGDKTITPLTSHQSLADYAKTSAVTTAISEATGSLLSLGDITISGGTITITKGGSSKSLTALTSHQSLAGYATQTWVTNKGYTKVAVDANGQLTIDGTAKTLSYSKLSGKPTIPSVSLANGTITIDGATIKPLTSHQSLSGYATQSWANSRFSRGWSKDSNGSLYRVERTGGAEDTSWHKIATFSHPSTSTKVYSACTIAGTIWYELGNHLQSRRKEIKFDVSLYAFQNSTTAKNTEIFELSANCTYDIIRLVKNSTNVWELQVRQHASYTYLTIEYTANNYNNAGTLQAGLWAAGTAPTNANCVVGAYDNCTRENEAMDWNSVKNKSGKTFKVGGVTYDPFGSENKELAVGVDTSTGKFTIGDTTFTPYSSKNKPTAADVGARASDWMPTASEVGARPSTWTPTAADVGVSIDNNGKITVGTKSLTPVTSLSGYATEDFVTGKGYATQTWVNNKGYLTSHQSLADYAKTSDVNTMLGGYYSKTDADSRFLRGYGTTKYRVERKGGGEDTGWKKIVAFSHPTTSNAQWDAVQVIGTIWYELGNHFQDRTLEIKFDASFYAFRNSTVAENTQILDLSANCEYDIIRIVKNSTNNWELQVRQHHDYTCLTIEYSVSRHYGGSGGTLSAGLWEAGTAPAANANVVANYNSCTHNNETIDWSSVKNKSLKTFTVGGVTFDPLGSENKTLTKRTFTVGGVEYDPFGSENKALKIRPVKVNGTSIDLAYTGNDKDAYDITAENVGVPEWARQNTKPSYTASEVGARASNWMPTAADVGARASDWMPTASDVGADPAGTAATKASAAETAAKNYADGLLKIKGDGTGGTAATGRFASLKIQLNGSDVDTYNPLASSAKTINVAGVLTTGNYTDYALSKVRLTRTGSAQTIDMNSVADNAWTIFDSDTTANETFLNLPNDADVDGGMAILNVRHGIYRHQLLFPYSATGRPYTRCQCYNQGVAWKGWQKFAFVSDLGNYLPLTGGTLTGNLTIGTNPIVGVGDTYMLAHMPTGGMTGVSTNQWGVGANNCQGVIRSNDTDLIHYRNGNATAARAILDSANYSSYITKSYVDGLGVNASTLGGYSVSNMVTGGWTQLNPYIYDSTNGTRHYSYKVGNANSECDVALRIRAFNDLNYASYGEWVLRINHTANYGRCVMLTPTAQNTCNLYVYIDSNYNVWVQCGIQWSSSLQLKVEKGNMPTITESVIGTPPNTLRTILNVGSSRDEVADAAAKLWTDEAQIGVSKARKMVIGSYDNRAFLASKNSSTDGDMNTIALYDTYTLFSHQVEAPSVNLTGHLFFSTDTSRIIFNSGMTGHYMESSSGGLSFAAHNAANERTANMATMYPSGAMTVYGQFTTFSDTLNGDTAWASDAGRLKSLTSTNYCIGMGANMSGYGEIQASQVGVGAKPLVLQKMGGNVGIGTTSPAYKLDVNGSMRASGTLSVCSNSGSYCQGMRIHAATDGWTTLMLCGAENTADTGTSANSWSMHAYQGNFYLNKNNSSNSTGNELCNVGGNWGIGTTSPDAKLHVAGAVHATDDITSDKECVSKFTTSSSDERLKRVTGGVDIALRSIAEAPSIRFDWRDGSGKDAGSIAQYWQDILPEAVRTDSKGYLTMQYGKLALLSAISLARNAVGHEARIAQLEGEVERLKQEVERLSA